MSETLKFLNRLITDKMKDTHVAMLCRIESFDAQRMKASVKPLGKGLPLINEVPVVLQKAGPFFIRTPFEKGDIVVVVFADRGIDNQINTGKEVEPTGQRQHALDDAIVVGGITPFNIPLPAEHSSDLLIATKDLKTKIVLSDGVILFKVDNGEGNWTTFSMTAGGITIEKYVGYAFDSGTTLP